MSDPKLPLVRILWDDAESFKDAWASKEETEEFAAATYVVVSIGWLVKKNRYYVTLASDYDPNHNNYGSVRKIPKKMIKKLELLQLVSTPTPTSENPPTV